MSERNDQILVKDDFEEACKKDGIKIIYEEPPQKGVGADYTERTTAPTATNPFYIKRGMGGYNPCILISGNSCLPNCVGYAHGRTLEIENVPSDGRVPTCNAKDWLAVAKANGLSTGVSPRRGAVIVWTSSGYGHVGVVERVYDDGMILVSQSDYGGSRFYMTFHYAPYHISGQTFIGFIYNPELQGNWRKDNKGWWYDYGDGTYPKNKWELINGKWYHFDSEGYMETGWLKLSGKWYFLEDSGAMATGWIKDKDHWYYANTDGVMQTGWQKIDNKWYFFAGSGDMRTGWLKDKGNWYYLDTDGHMVTGEKTVPCKFNEKGELV